jgi:hypothetical protein
MPEQQIDIVYTKSPLWRVVSATGAAINGIGTTAGGMEIVIRYTIEWVDVLKESFRADVDPAAGTMTVTQPSQFSLGPLSKIEEVAIKLSTEATTGMIMGLLAQWKQFSAPQQQRIRDEFAKVSKP